MKYCRPIACAMLGFLAACLATNDPQDIRYFAVEVPAPAQAAASAPQTELRFRLRRASSAAHLHERMVWRRSEVEYGFAEDRRWTEAPIAYVERALLDELVTVRGLVRSEALSAPALDIELFRFDEVIAPVHAARVAFVLRLIAPDGGVLLDRTIAAQDPIEGRAAEDVVQAMSRALAAASHQAADALVSAMQ